MIWNSIAWHRREELLIISFRDNGDHGIYGKGFPGYVRREEAMKEAERNKGNGRGGFNGGNNQGCSSCFGCLSTFVVAVVAIASAAIALIILL